MVWCGVMWYGMMVRYGVRSTAGFSSLSEKMFSVTVAESCSQSIHKTSQLITALTECDKGSTNKWTQKQFNG